MFYHFTTFFLVTKLKSIFPTCSQFFFVFSCKKKVGGVREVLRFFEM